MESGPKPSPDFLRILRPASELEGTVAGDHPESPEPAQAGDDVLGDAIAEVRLLWIAAHVVERQHGA